MTTQDSLFGDQSLKTEPSDKCPRFPRCSHAFGIHADGICTYPGCKCGQSIDLPTSPARSTDPATSHQAAAMPFRKSSQRYTLLCEYKTRHDNHGDGYTDEEAADFAGITKGCPWKRCSELREAGFIAPIGTTRMSDAGALQNVCAITVAGLAVLSTYPSDEA